MSLKGNLTANYVSQLYVAAIGILILPLYVQYMGAEAYGLVGFFTMLQSWFSLLDMGLTPTIARETARYHGGSMTALYYRQLFRSLSIIFLGVAVVGGAVLWLLAEAIASNWLKITELNVEEVVVAVKIMALSVALRWLGGLYRGVITGAERLVWLSSFNALIATLRFPAVFLSMWLWGFTPKVFFLHQLLVACMEIAGLFMMASKLKPVQELNQSIGWSFSPVKPLLKFAMTIAFTSSVWVLVTQTDKLILSGILPLSEYGYFTLAVLVASGIMILSAPVSNVIMPRMARLHAEGRYQEMLAVYRNATQLITIIAGSVAITIAICAEPLLYAWTGDPVIASKAAPILYLYALGNSILVVAAFPYYLQYAIGRLRYHLIGNLIMVLSLVPAIIFAASYYGGEGAGFAWLSVNLLYLVIWVSFVHEKLEPGLNRAWLVNDFLVIFVPVIVLVFLIRSQFSEIDTRLSAFLVTILCGVSSVFLSCLLSSLSRRKVVGYLKLSKFIE